uniref:DUF2383 domain-containing protein n=1 Tax=Phenylobacterium glaciei TaxID=2803784 RepID=A0A974P438_9CAUL|nr:DUF2383 domain-containing protein [Phenylobacterium glaciei]
MSTPAEHAVKVLNSLIETTLDSARGYKEAAHSSEDAQYKTMFSERSLKRMKITGDLQQEVRTFGASRGRSVRAGQGAQHVCGSEGRRHGPRREGDHQRGRARRGLHQGEVREGSGRR